MSALEVSRGQTGSLGWYPVLNTRLFAKWLFAKCRDTKTPGRGACPQGTLSLLAENAPILPFSQGLSLSPPQAPKAPTSPTLGISCQLSVLTLGPQPFQVDLKPPSYIQVWPCLKAATVLDAPPASISHPVFTSPCIITITASHTAQHPAPHSPLRLCSCLSLCPTPLQGSLQLLSKAFSLHRHLKETSEPLDGVRGPSWESQEQPEYISIQPRPLFGCFLVSPH